MGNICLTFTQNSSQTGDDIYNSKSQSITECITRNMHITNDFTQIHEGYFTGTRAIISLLHLEGSDPEGYR